MPVDRLGGKIRLIPGMPSETTFTVTLPMDNQAIQTELSLFDGATVTGCSTCITAAMVSIPSHRYFSMMFFILGVLVVVVVYYRNSYRLRAATARIEITGGFLLLMEP